jgi:hypothetical protein
MQINEKKTFKLSQQLFLFFLYTCFVDFILYVAASWNFNNLDMKSIKFYSIPFNIELCIPSNEKQRVDTEPCKLNSFAVFPISKAELQKFIKNSKKVQIDQNLSLNCMKLNPLSLCPIYFTRIRVYVL